MSYPKDATEPNVSPAQIWHALSTDHRARAIRLMAQLACNLVTEKIDASYKESHDEPCAYPR